MEVSAREARARLSELLKTLHAPHLAVTSSEGLDIVTADPGLYKSAKALSLKAILIE